MADFFAIDYNPADKKIYVTFNRTNKKPGEDLGHVATPMVVTQIAGPSLGGGTVGPVANRVALRSASADQAGDALSSYSILGAGVVPDPLTTNEPAGDFLSATVGPEIDVVDKSTVPEGGFTVTLKVADLSTTSLAQTLARTQSQSLLWIWRFTNGHQDAAASARWNPAQGFTFGYNDFTTGITPCGTAGPGSSASEKCILYPGDQPIQGDVNQATGTIRLSVPRDLLRALRGSTGPDARPEEVAATPGARFYDGTAFSLGNPLSAVQTVQSFLYPLDNTPSMDFLLPSGGGGGGGTGGCKVTGGGSIASGKFTISAHGGLTPKGSTAYRDADTDFNAKTITSVACSSATATVKGTGTNNGQSVTFEIGVVDGGSGGANDRYRLSLSSGGTPEGSLTKGNLTVHN